jgi:dihydrofolate synthase / folylpolyglutamate synthase
MQTLFRARSLSDWLVKIEGLHPETMKLGLERVAKIANELQLIRFDCPVIIVGGTNGKGSCVKFLETIFQSEGYLVGAYTSPHLLSLTERIRLAGQNIANNLLCQAFEVIEIARKDRPLTFFEFTTLSALWLYKQANLDVLILEVGLGGRLDAVNIVDADIAIITSIDLDHTAWLGNTREEIGYQKAGIFRPQGIAIYGDLSPPASLKQYAKFIHTELYCVGEDFSYTIYDQGWAFKSTKTKLNDLPLPALPIENAATAIMAVSKLEDRLPIRDAAILKGIKEAYLPGRFQVIENPSSVLDVAHNPGATRMLVEKIKFYGKKRKWVVVAAMLADKDMRNTLSPIVPYAKTWFLGSLKTQRGATSQVLAHHLQDFTGINCYTYDSVTAAFKAAASSLEPDTSILAFGSFYTVAEILNLRQKENLLRI